MRLIILAEHLAKSLDTGVLYVGHAVEYAQHAGVAPAVGLPYHQTVDVGVVVEGDAQRFSGLYVSIQTAVLCLGKLVQVDAFRLYTQGTPAVVYLRNGAFLVFLCGFQLLFVVTEVTVHVGVEVCIIAVVDFFLLDVADGDVEHGGGKFFLHGADELFAQNVDVFYAGKGEVDAGLAAQLVQLTLVFGGLHDFRADLCLTYHLRNLPVYFRCLLVTALPEPCLTLCKRCIAYKEYTLVIRIQVFIESGMIGVDTAKRRKNFGLNQSFRHKTALVADNGA